MDVSFSPDDGREDKLGLAIGRWYIPLEDKDELWGFRCHLAVPPKKHKKLEGDSDYGWVFCRPQNQAKGANRLWVLGTKPQKYKERNLVPRIPLFSGFAAFHAAEGGRRIELTLTLNLQRFIRHQTKTATPSKGQKMPASPRIIKRSDARSSYGKEFAFDGSDNWIPNVPAWTAFANLGDSALHLRQYVSKTAKLFERECKRALIFVDGSGSAKVEREEYHALNEVETVWEFASNDPIGDVFKIGNAAMACAHKGEAEKYLVKLGTSGWELNSPRYLIPLAHNVALRLYAKTSRRIRFEVVHSGLRKKSWAELTGATDKPPPRSLDDLIKAIKKLREQAAGHLNKLMDGLREGTEQGPLCSPVVDLLAEIASSIPVTSSVDDRARLSRMLLYLICFQRGYRGGLPSGELAESLVTLKKRGVIVWDKSRKFYRLAPKFVLATNALQDGTGSPFTAIFGGSETTRQFYLSNGEIIRDRVLKKSLVKM